MRIFDLHADLAIAIRQYPNETAVLKNHWDKRLEKGEIMYSAAASFFAGKESWQDMMDTVTMVRNDIIASGHKPMLSMDDLDPDSDHVSYLMTVEGMCGIHDHPEEKIDWLYEQGNRIGSLEWNDENDLATGNSGHAGRGLTDLGRRAIARMNERHMVVDVSHANEKTFWDILDASTRPVIATHSNAKALCYVPRNLTDQQIVALCDKGGLIGLNACEEVIAQKQADRSARTLAKHARFMADLVGVSHVAVGFDLGGYYNKAEGHDLYDPEQAQNFIEGLKAEGFSEEEIADIAWRNVYHFLQDNL